MATWVTHLIIADNVLDKIPTLCRHEFCVGNIAPDCNVENEDWTHFTPSREVTHWMSGERKTASDCDKFYEEYIEKRKHTISSVQEKSFLWGYYAHLITDAEFQRYIRDDKRIEAVWDRIVNHAELSLKANGMPKNWDSVKLLINKEDRMKDIYSIENEYLEKHPQSGYLTEILGLKSFPDYIDYLPNGSIIRKINIMGYRPKKESGKYPYIGMSKDEYATFINQATKLVLEAIYTHLS
ncbi:MAG: zinc dependent phospholipase C family protein [Lachnospiraceae bacterium]|nr:zinc dependent phospholipase C family protein [Lachnospiraceae bacterium]